jgi:hypothetical protein
MTASHERALLARARELADATHELGDAIAVTVLGGARTAGLDPAAYAPLTGAALALGADRIAVYRALGPAHRNDVAFLSAVADAEDDARDLFHAVGSLVEQVTAALNEAHEDLDDEDATARAADARERIRACEHALEVLAELDRRLRHAIARLQATPAALGETYQAVYDLIRADGRMPLDGRWITGEEDTIQATA